MGLLLAVVGLPLLAADLPVAGRKPPSKPPTIQQALKNQKKRGLHRKPRKLKNPAPSPQTRPW